jgi:predicted RNA-binding protein associated with RNAse of E/G family
MNITILKKNVDGNETWRYSGEVLQYEPTRVVLQAQFNRPDMLFNRILLKQGDRFVETFYTDRWYNIFAIYDRDDAQLKGWYCNVAEPAVIEETPPGELQVSYVDLALDLLVYPDGRQLVLDEDEFIALSLPPETQIQARHALDELSQLFKTTLPPE